MRNAEKYCVICSSQVTPIKTQISKEKLGQKRRHKIIYYLTIRDQESLQASLCHAERGVTNVQIGFIQDCLALLVHIMSISLCMVICLSRLVIIKVTFWGNASNQGCHWLNLRYRTIHRIRITEKIQNFFPTYRTIYRTNMEIYRNNTEFPIDLQNRLQNKFWDLKKNTEMVTLVGNLKKKTILLYTCDVCPTTSYFLNGYQFHIFVLARILIFMKVSNQFAWNQQLCSLSLLSMNLSPLIYLKNDLCIQKLPGTSTKLEWVYCISNILHCTT